MARKNMWATFHKAYRAAYRVNRALTTGQVLASGSPRRIVRLGERRIAYKLFAKFINRVLR